MKTVTLRGGKQIPSGALSNSCAKCDGNFYYYCEVKELSKYVVTDIIF